MQELRDLAVGVAVAKDRQAKSGLGNEHVALNELKGGTRGITDVLVIAGGYDAQARKLDRHLRGTEHVACWMESHPGAAQAYCVKITNALVLPAGVFAISKPH